MVIGLLFASLACLCGLAVIRAVRAPLTLVPFSGLAAIIVVATWCAALGDSGTLSTALIVTLAAAGAVLGIQAAWSSRLAWSTGDRISIVLLAASVALPWTLLGVAMAGNDTPLSTHDGAFHVETIDTLRRGIPVQGWYPMGFHASTAAVLRLVPWVDTARGTEDAAQALVVLAPLGIFALGRALGLSARLSSIGALILALTYIYPYDDHVWGGWPLGTSMLLLLGLLSVGARWVGDPRTGLAAVGGLLAGAIVLTHGTEVYSSVIGLTVLAAMNWRRLRAGSIARSLSVAALVAGACAGPYLSAVVGWAQAGGASTAGAVALADAASQPGAADSGGDALEFILALTGAASLIDLPLRAVLMVIGASQRKLRAAFAAWLVFSALLFAISFVDVQPIRSLYIATFPWLVHHRPPQLVTLFTSLLAAAGLVTATNWFRGLRPVLAAYSGAWRRLALVACALLFFFAEGSAVSIFKTLAEVINQQSVYSADDRAAMAWLQQQAAPGEMVINDGAADAGIWAPYKAGVAVLLPRSASALLQQQREHLLSHVLMLADSPSDAEAACALRADYVYAGSRRVAGDPELLPDRQTLEQASDLQEMFVQGEAAVFRVKTNCSTDTA